MFYDYFGLLLKEHLKPFGYSLILLLNIVCEVWGCYSLQIIVV